PSALFEGYAKGSPAIGFGKRQEIAIFVPDSSFAKVYTALKEWFSPSIFGGLSFLARVQKRVQNQRKTPLQCVVRAISKNNRGA
ncbi:MAG: hypothetical protein J6Y32_00875, partial [Bacteroidales bacterium]|nr:hypothetical protein [Bacteroidales bacterium]